MSDIDEAHFFFVHGLKYARWSEVCHKIVRSILLDSQRCQMVRSIPNPNPVPNPVPNPNPSQFEKEYLRVNHPSYIHRIFL